MRANEDPTTVMGQIRTKAAAQRQRLGGVAFASIVV
jgi:hypothetical protein